MVGGNVGPQHVLHQPIKATLLAFAVLLQDAPVCARLEAAYVRTELDNNNINNNISGKSHILMNSKSEASFACRVLYTERVILYKDKNSVSNTEKGYK